MLLGGTWDGIFARLSGRELTTMPSAIRSGRFWLWHAPLLLWLAFCFWYTNTAGPLTPDEIEDLTTRLAQGGTPAEGVERIRRFMAEDEGDQFLMVNLLHRASTPDADKSMARYMAHMLPAMLKRASHPMLSGATVADAMDLAGIEGAETWSSVGVVRYRSRRDLMAIATDPAFGGEHEFKLAALAKTIAVPVQPDIYLADLRVLLLVVLLAVVGVVNALWRSRV